jgi:predicted  nucleic acid-binding Zn-ribbon protein
MAERGRKQKINCPSCGKNAFRSVSAINRAKKDGLKIYCSLKCSAIGRRKDNPKTPNNPKWKAMKAEYDRNRRKEKDEELKAQKKAAYAIWGPKHREEERQKRKENMPKHVEYCRQPEYKEKKKDYDRKVRVEQYGEFAESYELLEELVKEIKHQMPDRFERYSQSGRQQWSPINQQRRRYARASRINS